MKMKGLLLALIITMAVFMAGTASANGNGADTSHRTDGAIYYEGVLYGTILTPTTLPDKAPDHSFDVLYFFNGTQPSVAEAAPGVKGYNGGRWIVYLVEFNNGVVPYLLTSVQEVIDAETDGDVTISAEPITRFVCPMLKLK